MNRWGSHRRAARPGLFVVSAAVALSMCASTAQAKASKIDGSLGSLPTGAEYPAVMAVSPQGKIDGFALTSGSGAFNLAVPAGTYVIASTASEGDTSLAAFSTPTRVKAGHSTKVKSKLELSAKAASTGHGLLPSKSIVTITDFEFTNDLDATAPEITQLRNVVINDVFTKCTDAGIVFVDTSPEFVKFAKQEKALSSAGRLAVPYEYKPLKPQYEVFGSGSVEDKGAGDELRLSLIATTTAHQIVPGSEVNLETTLPEFSIADALSSLATLSSEFATKVCGA